MDISTVRVASSKECISLQHPSYKVIADSPRNRESGCHWSCQHHLNKGSSRGYRCLHLNSISMAGHPSIHIYIFIYLTGEGVFFLLRLIFSLINGNEWTSAVYVMNTDWINSISDSSILLINNFLNVPSFKQKYRFLSQTFSFSVEYTPIKAKQLILKKWNIGIGQV